MKIDRITESVLALAGAQHGVVSRGQMLAAGMTADRIDSWLQRGRLRPLHRGVYALGPVAAPFEREMAALLACGPDAVISHRTCGGLLRLCVCDAGSPIDVSVSRGRCRSAQGVRLHRVRVHAGQVHLLGPLRVTSVARTLLDLAVCLTPVELERAAAQALRDRLVTVSQMRDFLNDQRGRPGSRILREVLLTGPAFTRSEAEVRFLDLIRRAGLAVPDANVRISGCEVDFLWRSARLVVEIDGFAWHGDRAAFERDRQRDARLIGAGLTVMRITWRRLRDSPYAVVARLAGALAQEDS